MSTSTTQAMSRSQEILLVSRRELRNQLLKKSTIVSTAIMLVIIVVGIVVASRLTADAAGPYRLGVSGSTQEVATLTPVLAELSGANGEPITVVELSDTAPETALSEDADEAGGVDMVLDLSAEPRLLVQESADEAVATGVTASIVDAIPDAGVDLDSALVAALVRMIVGYATFSVAFGAAGALVSRQEDVGNAVRPLILLCAIPFTLSFFMILGDPEATVWRVLCFVPPLSAFLMPARLIFGVSSWIEQAIGLAIAVAFLPLLVRVAAAICTRAVTRMGSRVRLKEVLGRAAG